MSSSPQIPAKLKEDILRKSGSEIPTDLTIEAALSTENEPVRAEPDPGDEDPSRDIGSAEVGMSFDGKSNSGSADLGPYLQDQVEQISRRMNEAQEDTDESSS